MSDFVEMIPLGGVGEFGMNCAVLRAEQGLILMDAGMTFPRSDQGSDLGVNVVVPEIEFLREHQEDLLGVFLTHGHEDHIGAISYIAEDIPLKVFGSPLTLGLVENRLRERGLLSQAELRPLTARKTVRLGPFSVEPIEVTHSFPESYAFGVKTPAGTLLWTGDFKIDQTPIDERPSDLHRLAALGEEGVLALFSDSTNSSVPGLSPSESLVVEPIRGYFREIEGKIVVSCFSSSIHRIQTVIRLAQEFGRQVVTIGRSLSANVRKAAELGYLQIPSGILSTVRETRDLPPKKLVVLAAGSQGEPMSAMSRLAVDEFRGLRIEENDLVILSARVIPGNTRRVDRLIDHVYRRGARVVDARHSSVHASGHAYREDLKLMINLVKPRHFVPIHGDYRQLKEHTLLARRQGLRDSNIHLIENGQVLRFQDGGAELNGHVPAGRRFIDEGYTGEVHEMVLRDRRFLSEDGFLVVVMRMDRFEGSLIGEPELISRGFVLMEDAEDLMNDLRTQVVDLVEDTSVEEIRDQELFNEILRKSLKKTLRKRTGKRPLVLPVTLEI